MHINNKKHLKPKKQAPNTPKYAFYPYTTDAHPEPTSPSIPAAAQHQTPTEQPHRVDQPNLNPIVNSPIPMGDPNIPTQPDNVHGRYGRAIRDLRSKNSAKKPGITFDKPAKETRKSKSGLDNHFWYNVNTGESHDVDFDSSYHIQHIVRNPTTFGYKDAEDMQQHTKMGIAELKKGRPDVDYDLEHHLMEKGFARGYHNSEYDRNSERAWTKVDVASEEHKNKFLAKILPHLKKVAPNGSISISVGKRGYRVDLKGKVIKQKEYDFRNAAEAEKHLKGIEPIKPLVPDAPRPTIVPGKPLSSTDLHTMRKKFKVLYPNKSKTQIDREVQRVSGVWGDSVELPTSFGTFFSEMIKRINK